VQVGYDLPQWSLFLGSSPGLERIVPAQDTCYGQAARRIGSKTKNPNAPAVKREADGLESQLRGSRTNILEDKRAATERPSRRHAARG